MAATELAGLLRRREVSAVEVLEAHLGRIEAVNPLLNAIVTLAPEQAFETAREADRRAVRGERLGRLHGMPIAIKDLEETRGIRTTFGSPIYAEYVPEEDSLLVRRLRDEGAVVLGKTNTPEFGAGSQTFNPVFGPTRNPYDPSLTAGGSSGGAAAAVATAMLPFADGSDAGGSLRNPAAFCNVVGMRPSPGRVCESGATDGWSPTSVHGPIARTVPDAALLLSAMSNGIGSPLAIGPDGDDLAAVQARRPGRIGWSSDLGGLPIAPEVSEVLAFARTRLEAAGYEIEDVDSGLDGADEAFEVLRALSFVGEFSELYRSKGDLMKETIVWNLRQGLALTPERIASALRKRTEVFRSMAALLSEMDLLAAPVNQVAPFPVEIEWIREIRGQSLSHYLEWMRACSRVTVTAHPAISIPAGFSTQGLPVGLQLIGHYRDERRLLSASAAVEETLGASRRRPPERGPG